MGSCMPWTHFSDIHRWFNASEERSWLESISQVIDHIYIRYATILPNNLLCVTKMLLRTRVVHHRRIYGIHILPFGQLDAVVDGTVYGMLRLAPVYDRKNTIVYGVLCLLVILIFFPHTFIFYPSFISLLLRFSFLVLHSFYLPVLVLKCSIVSRQWIKKNICESWPAGNPVLWTF